MFYTNFDDFWVDFNLYFRSKKIKASKIKKLNKKNKQKADVPAYKAEDLKLPKKFAEQVLELEMNITTLKQVQRLVALYSKAVEFYNGKSDSRYLIYQDKIEKLMTEQRVMDMLSSKANNEKCVNPEPKAEIDPKTKRKLKKKENMLKMNLHMSNQEQEKMGVKSKIIEDHTIAQDTDYKIIQGDLNEQTSNLSVRLQERRNKMKKEQQTLSTSGKVTNSSTPNQGFSHSKAETEGTTEYKSDSSGTNSVGDGWVYKLNLGDLSDELMDRLKLLQEGYDENDYDNDQLFDEEAFEEEIDQILTKCDEEVENIIQEDSTKIEAVYEKITNEKYEKLAETKAEYKYRIKNASTKEEAEELNKEMESEIEQINLKYSEMKSKEVTQLKTINKEKIRIKRENVKQVINKVRRSVSRKASRQASRGRTPREFKEKAQPTFNLTNFAATDKKVLEKDISKGLGSKNAEFKTSFRLPPKGPINMNNLVVRKNSVDESP